MNDALLNPDNGHLEFSDSFSVSPATTPEMIDTYFGKDQVSLNDMKNGWVHHTVRNLHVANRYFIFTFYFEKEVLRRISINVDQEPDSGGKGWDDWSLDKERRNEGEYDKWLTGQVGGMRRFAWGTVNSLFDERAAFSYIMLIYKE